MNRETNVRVYTNMIIVGELSNGIISDFFFLYLAVLFEFHTMRICYLWKNKEGKAGWYDA